MNPIIKWPGGKSREIDKIENLIPDFDRYIEPFFGGGALFFHLMPAKAKINDISTNLIEYYRLIKKQDETLHKLLLDYSNSFNKLIEVCSSESKFLLDLFYKLQKCEINKTQLSEQLNEYILHLPEKLGASFENIVLNNDEFIKLTNQMVVDKYVRTVANHIKKPFSKEDLADNLTTGFTSGYYMYFRKVFNDINLKRIDAPSIQYQIANFYFVREYCYGSMFRYNSKGEFNIPYGGMSYNKKNLENKIEKMFNSDISSGFKNTDICCMDFEEFIEKSELNENDFMFLDPPYDTDFSDYEGKDFSRMDQERLANTLKSTKAKFILVIKNTDFIFNLYKDNFNILSFDKQYTYNVRSRNDRDVEHLIITNLPV